MDNLSQSCPSRVNDACAHFLLEIWPVQGKDVGNDGGRDEVIVRDELGRGER